MKNIWGEGYGRVIGFIGLEGITAHEGVHVSDAAESHELALKEIERTYLTKCMKKAKAKCFMDLSPQFGYLALVRWKMKNEHFHVYGRTLPNGESIGGGYFNYALDEAKKSLIATTAAYQKQSDAVQYGLMLCEQLP
jgi:hypothetical protein